MEAQLKITVINHCSSEPGVSYYIVNKNILQQGKEGGAYDSS